MRHEGNGVGARRAGLPYSSVAESSEVTRNAAPGADWRVTVTHRGRSGTVRYVERENVADFGWEYCGAFALVAIDVPVTAELWAQAVPWAADRQWEIIERVASEVLRQQAPGCIARAHLGYGCIEILTPEGVLSAASIEGPEPSFIRKLGMHGT